jgi:hypothetical protein
LAGLGCVPMRSYQPPPNQPTPPYQPGPYQPPPNQPPSWGQPPSGGWQPPSPQPGPAPGVEFAGFGSRFLAYIIDAFILGVVIVVCLVVLGVAAGVGVGSVSRPTPSSFVAVGVVGLIFLLVALLLVFAYYPWCWSHGGQTLGQRAIGHQGRSRFGWRTGGRGTGHPQAHRLLGFGCRLLSRLHLDLHRRAAPRLARPHRRHGRHYCSLTPWGALPTARGLRFAAERWPSG